MFWPPVHYCSQEDCDVLPVAWSQLQPQQQVSSKKPSTTVAAEGH